MAKLERQSNLELLRILSMFGVLTSHSLTAMYDLHTANFSLPNEIRVYIMNASVLAVNCFVLISGYFQIKQSWRGFVKLLSPCFFYVLFFSLIAFFMGKMNIKEMVIRSIFPLTETNMWFLITYFGLFLLSPLLNTAFNAQDKIQRIITLICLLFIDVYLGYMHQSKEITIDGYHLIHFVVIYYLGSFVKSINLKISNLRLLWGGYFFLVLLMTMFHMIKMVFSPIAIVYSMRYNSPSVKFVSLFLFILFTQLNIKSKKINWIASSVLAVYIISEQLVINRFYYGGLCYIQQNYSEWTVIVVIPCIMVLFYLSCIFIDKMRIQLFSSVEITITNRLERLKGILFSLIGRNLR